MSTKPLVLALLVACAGARQLPTAQEQRFQLEMPASPGLGPTVLVLRDVTVPRNASLTLRVRAVSEDTTILLGSTAIPGISREATGTHTIPELRVVVTSGLRRWAAANPTARSVVVAVVVVPGDGPEGAAASWSVRTAEFIQPR